MTTYLRMAACLAVPLLLLGACATASTQPAQADVEPARQAPGEQALEPGEHDSAAAPSSVETPDWYETELTDVNNGMPFKVADFHGQVVLVETMAIWCSNCLKQQKEVKALHSLVGEREDFVSVGINIDPNEDVQQLADYTGKNGFDWLYVAASEDLINEIGALYGPQYLNPPATPMLIIDKQGAAHLLPFGIKSAAELQTFLQPYFDEM